MRASRRLLCVGLLLVFVVPLAADTPALKKPFPDLLAEAQAHSKDQKWAEAGPLWQKIVEQNPINPGFWAQLAKARYEQKEYRPAIAAYTKAYELRAGYPANSAYDMACCHALLGEKEPALKWLETAFSRGFRDLTHAQTDGDFEIIRDDPKYRDLVMLVDTDKMSRDEGWRHDLKLAAREIKRMHYNPYREFTREQFDAHVKKLHDDIPKLNDHQVKAGLMKLFSMAGDGHTSLRPGGAVPMLPLQLFQFEDGTFVTAAAPECADLAGAQILKVGEHSTAAVLTAVEPAISRDNAMGVKALARIIHYREEKRPSAASNLL